MKNSKKICLFLALLLVSASNISFAQEKNNGEVKVTEVFSEDIKGNKASLEKAQDAMTRKDYQSAIVYLTAYIDAKPKKYEAYELRGDCFYALRQYYLAKLDYEKAIEIKTSDDKFITNTKYVSAIVLGADKKEQLQNPELGELYAKLMYSQKALNDISYELSYKKAGEYNSHMYLPQPKKEDINKINCPQKYGKIFNPQGNEQHIQNAISHIENENYHEAIYPAQMVTSSYPNYYLGYYLTGVALAGLEKYDEAITSFNQALKYNPYDFESMASLGQIYFTRSQETFSQDDARKSTQYFNQALKYNKNCNLYYFYIGLNEMMLANTENSIYNFNKAISIKANDYNSMYYRAIAQYIAGDYKSVLNEATKLLYKHVSNSNSVLYLRALANYKLKDFERAQSDLDIIISNTEDIYNLDVKVLTEKEKTLLSYVYYLKSLIAKSQGEEYNSDLAKAKQNPIIALLAKAKDTLQPYEDSLSGESLTLENYENYNNFYTTGLPKMLESSAVITENDIDNQYDYIRTTFEDMGISFVYDKDSSYKITTIKDYPYKKYSSKLSEKNLEQVSKNTPEVVVTEVKVQEEHKPILKQETPQTEMLARENEFSIAKMLAMNSFDVPSDNAVKIKGNVPVDTNTESSEEIKKDTNTVISNYASGEDSVYTEKPSSLSEQNEKSIDTIKKEEQEINLTPTASNEIGTVITAPEQKEVKDFTITYNKDNDKILEKTQDLIDTAQEVATQTEEISKEIKKDEAQTIKPEKTTAEKHAQIDFTEFVQSSTFDESILENNPDVVVLNTNKKPLYDKAELDSITEMNSSKNLFTDKQETSLPRLKHTQEETLQIIETSKEENDDNERIILPEEPEEKVKIDLKTQSTQEVKETQEKTLAEKIDEKLTELDKEVKSDQADKIQNVPVVVVPDVNIPETAKEEITEPSTEKITQNTQEQVVEISDIQETINNNIPEFSNEKEITPEISLKELRKQLKQEAAAKKLQAKQAKQEAKRLAKEEKAKAKADAAALKEQIKKENLIKKQEAKEAAQTLKLEQKNQKLQAEKEAKELKEQLKQEKEKIKAEAKSLKKQKQEEKQKNKAEAKAKQELEKALSVFQNNNDTENTSEVSAKKVIKKLPQEEEE